MNLSTVACGSRRTRAKLSLLSACNQGETVCVQVMSGCTQGYSLDYIVTPNPGKSSVIESIVSRGENYHGPEAPINRVGPLDYPG